MKKLLLAGCVLMAFSASAHAEEKWEVDSHRCYIHKLFSHDEMVPFGKDPDGQTILIEPKDIPDIEKALPRMKKCMMWIQCLNNRAAGKVKHCYENDKRWQ